MKKIRRKNKKGQIGESIQDIVGTVFVIILLIIFIILSTVLWVGNKKEIKTIAENQALIDQSHISFKALLQKAVVINYENKEQNITISELIRLSKINQSYKAILEEELEKNLVIYSYNFEIFETTQIIETKKGGLFYIPSNETMVAILEIKRTK